MSSNQMEALIENPFEVGCGVTQQQTRVATLLASGQALSSIASQLGITQSTLDKHLLNLRRKVGVSSTIEMAALFSSSLARRRLTSRQPSAPSDSDWRVFSSTSPASIGVDWERIDTNQGLEQSLVSFCASRRHECVGGVAYRFYPRGLASLRSGSAIAAATDCPLGSGDIRKAWVGDPICDLDRFRDQRNWQSIHLLDNRGADSVDPGWVLSVGFSRGPGLIAMSFRFVPATLAQRDELVSRSWNALRDSMIELHDGLLSRRVLARTVDLTRLERGSLRLLAEGKTIRGAAEEFGCGERNVARAIGAARRKLKAQTNPEAVAEAMALNVLSFS